MMMVRHYRLYSRTGTKIHLDRFQSVSESLAAATNLRIDQRPINGDNQLCLLEGYKQPIPLGKASDGTLRLVAYYILLNEPELPPLIAIEEPERNLHPSALTDITNVLEQISEHSQVIITTHSSQLLDAFNPETLIRFTRRFTLTQRSRTAAQKSSTLKISAVTEQHWTVGLRILELAVPFSIVNCYKISMEEPACQT